VNAKLRQQLKQRKQRTLRRIDKQNWDGSSPMIQPAKVHYELADKQQAIAAGGIGALVQLANRLDLRKAINRSITLFKMHLPYDEADHVLNIALNLLAGGDCLEHLEDRRCDEAYLNALGAQRIPDPTTAGDFCRRFHDTDILFLMNGFNEVREQVWKEQPREFFDCAIIEADGTQVETSAEKKQGIGMNYKGQWGYHPLVVTLANTREPLFIANRSGNRPSHEHAAAYLGLAVDRCRKAGFRKIVLRGDTDFALTENFDHWDDDDVEFVFGIDAMPNLVSIAEELDKSAWNTLNRRRAKQVPPASQRAKRPRYKEQVVERNGYLNKKLVSEQIAEFNYRPGKCDRDYRVVVLKKEVHLKRGQLRLFDEEKPVYFFYITNATKSAKPTRQVVIDANARCNQENNIAQLKQCALSAPLDNLTSNWAYMVIASLAWSLKAWAALGIKPAGNAASREEQTRVKNKLLAMDFTTFRDRVLMVPAQIIRGGRRIIYRLLSYRPSVDMLMLIVGNVHRPLRC
jgi:putative NIF3 family GTP cyclohydrolase 1 type 2